MSAIQVFKSPEFGNLTTRKDELGREYFRAIDACSVLRLGNASLALHRHVSPENVFQYDDGTNRAGLTNYVNEPGFYELVFKAKTDRAKSFQRWVFEEVLPKLRASRITDAASLLNGFPDMQQRFENLLEIEAKYLKSLESSFNEPEIVLDPFPYTPEQLQSVSGIRSIYHVRNSIRLNFKAEVDYLADEGGKPLAIAESAYHILALCFRSMDGVDLNQLPEQINLRVVAYFSYRAKKQINQLIAHPDQLDLF